MAPPGPAVGQSIILLSNRTTILMRGGMAFEQQDSVCVIGAGVSGLVSAKVLKHDGFDVTVFDNEPTIGGVWAPSRTYAGLCTNNPKEHYAFSDFRYPETCDEFPTAEQVLEYLQLYVDEFGLRSHIRLSTDVLSVSRESRQDGRSHPGFEVTVRATDGSAEPVTHAFDYVVVCNGVYSIPYVPEFEGQERFEGLVLHSSEMLNREMLWGKRIVVVGAGKSALDCASVAAHEADSTTLVFRTPHWMLPRYLPGRKRVDEVFFTRLSEKILPAYFRVSPLEKALRTVLASILWAGRRAMSAYVSRACNMPPELIPKEPMSSAAAENLGIGTRFFEAFEQGLADVKRAGIQSFSGEHTLQLDTGEQIEADIVIFATGWQQDVTMLNPPLHREVRRDGKFHLYRHILPPREQRLAFNGYASAGNQAITSEIAAHWLSACFLGELELPDATTMEEEIAERHAWAQKAFPSRNQGYFVGAYVASYVDELMQDMQLRVRRAESFVSEYLEPINVENYRDLAGERRGTPVRSGPRRRAVA
jgi:dimethylaniline monooxygenase (N-oxide forming)